MINTADRSVLESKERDELLQIAVALGIEIQPRARKPSIIEAILSPAADPPDAPSAPASHGLDDHAVSQSAPGWTPVGSNAASPQPAPSAAAATPRPDSAAVGSSTDVVGSAADSTDPAVSPVSEDGNRRARRRGGREPQQAPMGDVITCDGLLDLRDEGYGFLRTNGPLPSPDDVYVAARQIRQYGLRRGDRIVGASRPAARSERNPALLRLDTLNGAPPDSSPDRPHFDACTAVYPCADLALGSPNALQAARGVLGLAGQTAEDAALEAMLRDIDACAPVGCGSRALVVAPPRFRWATFVVPMAAAICEAHPEVHVIVLFVDERPEDVTEAERRLEAYCEVVSADFASPPEEQVATADLTLERLKRVVETGTDVVLLFAGLTRLTRALLAQPPGRSSHASVTPAAAVNAALQFFGAARNLQEIGSLTMLACADEAGLRPGSLESELLYRAEQAATLEIALRCDPLPGAVGHVSVAKEASYSLGHHLAVQTDA